MSCRDFIPRGAHARKRNPPDSMVVCDDCTGDGVVSGNCSCGRCESPPDVRCPTCNGDGHVDEVVEPCYLCGEPSTCTAHLTGDYANFQPGVHPVCQPCFDDAVLLGEVSALSPAELARVKDADLQGSIDMREIQIDFINSLTNGALRPE